MRVEVRLYATLRKYSPGEPGTPFVELVEGSMLNGLLEFLRIPQHQEIVVLINGRPAQPDSVLREGDRVVMFPPVTGG